MAEMKAKGDRNAILDELEANIAEACAQKNLTGRMPGTKPDKDGPRLRSQPGPLAKKAPERLRMTDFSILPYESHETGSLPDDLMAGYHTAARIAEVADSLSQECLANMPEGAVWIMPSTLERLAIGDPEDVFKHLTANTQEINCVRNHPASYWDIVFPNAHLVCFRLWDKLLYAAWSLANRLGLDSGKCCEDRWDFEVFKFSVFKGHEQAARDHFFDLGLPRTQHLLAELQLEVSRVAQRRRDAQFVPKPPEAAATGSRKPAGVTGSAETEGGPNSEEEPVMESVYPDWMAAQLPPDLKAAFSSAKYLIETARSIVWWVEIAALPDEDRQADSWKRSDALPILMKRTKALFGKIKECESFILGVAEEIADANRRPVKVTSRIASFPDAHRAALDIGALVCEVIWDGTFQKRGFPSSRELYSLPLTPKDVEASLPYISDQFRGLLGQQDWYELSNLLQSEAATTAQARQNQSGPGELQKMATRRDFVESARNETNTPNFAAWAGDERVTLAIVFTDIVGSTALGEELKDETMNEVRRAHFAQSRKLIDQFQGREIKTIGDSFMTAFRSVEKALAYAIALHSNPGHAHVRIRAGIHIGPMQVEENDAFGGTINFAARVVGAIVNAEIWLSDRAKDDLTRSGAKQHSQLKWERHDAVQMKGFNGTFTLWSVKEDKR